MLRLYLRYKKGPDLNLATPPPSPLCVAIPLQFFVHEWLLISSNGFFFQRYMPFNYFNKGFCFKAIVFIRVILFQFKVCLLQIVQKRVLIEVLMTPIVNSFWQKHIKMRFEKSSYKFMMVAHTCFNNTALLKIIQFVG